MIFLCKEETHAGFLQKLDALFRALLDIYAQRLQTVRRAALGGGGAVSVLCDLDPARRSHQRGCGGNVEAVRIVSAGADDFQELHIGFHPDGVFPHSGGAAGDFIDGFRLWAFCGKGRQKRGVLRRRGFAVHYLVHYGIRLVIGQVGLVYDFFNGFLNHGYALLYLDG